MAYQQDFTQDDDQQNGQANPDGQILSSGGSTTSAPGAQTSTAGSGQVSSGQTAAPSSGSSKQGSTGYTNLSSYLNANQEQSSNLANQVINPIKSADQQQQQGVTGYQSTNQSAIQNGTDTDKGVIKQLNSSPSSFSGTDWKNQYNNQLTGYQGPSYSDIIGTDTQQNLANQTAQTSQQVKGLTDDNQLSGDIKNLTKDPTYTQGQNNFDTFLAGGGPGRQALTDYQTAYNANNAGTNLTNANTGLQNSYNSAVDTSNKTVADTQAAAQNQFNTYQNQLQGLNKQVGQQASQATTTYNNYLNSLIGGDAHTSQEFGVDPNALKTAMGLGFNPTTLLATQGAPQTLADAATPDQIAAYQALAGLTNQSTDPTLDLSTKSGATGAPTIARDATAISALNQFSPLYTNAQSALQKDQATRNQDYQSALNAVSGIKSMSQFTPQQLDANAKALGMSTQDYMTAGQAGLLGSGILQKGSALTLGSELGSNSSQYQKLASMLGLSGAPSGLNTNPASAAFTLSPQFQSALKAAQAANVVHPHANGVKQPTLTPADMIKGVQSTVTNGVNDLSGANAVKSAARKLGIG